MRRIFIIAAVVSMMPSAPAFAGGGCHSVGAPDFVDPRKGTVFYSQCRVAPDVARVEPGQTVHWTSTDVAPHTVTSGNGLWDSIEVTQTKDFSFTFDRTGVYSYYCMYHPNMGGTVIVEDDLGDTPVRLTDTTPAAARSQDGGNAAVPIGLGAGIAGLALGLLSSGLRKGRQES